MWFFTALSIAFRFLFTLLFRKNKLPDLIENIDDQLTLQVSDYRRNRIVNFLNYFLSSRLMQVIISKILSWSFKTEFVDIKYTLQLDSREYAIRETRKILENKDRDHWTNWIGSHCADPLKIRMPGNGRYEKVAENFMSMTEYDFAGLKEVQQIVKDAEEKKLRVRCVASGHALSDINLTTDFLLISKKMTLPQRRANQPYIKEKLRSHYKVVTKHDGSYRTENRYLFETGSGTLIVDLKDILEKEGLAFQNLGGADVQGIFGAITTSTHGNGMHLKPLPDMVKSLVLVAAGGKAYRIEPADGITDRDLYEKSDEYLKHGIDLVQDDDDFYSAVVSMGCFGVVISLVMEVMDIYYLHEERSPSTWEIEREILLDPSKNYLNNFRHLDITINPYPLSNTFELDLQGGDHFCLVNTKEYAGLSRDDARKKQDYNGQKRRNFLSSLVGGIYFAGSVSTWVFNQKPESIPKSIRGSMMRIADNKNNGLGFTAIYSDVLNQGLKQMKFFGFALEIVLPIENNRHIDAIDHILKIMGEMSEYHQYVPGPIAVRFIDSSDAYLSMMYGRKSCAIEIFSLKEFIGGKEMLQRIEREMYQFGARPHWGLSFDTIDIDKMEALYPKFHQWKKCFQKYNKGGVFDNVFTDRARLNEIPVHG